MAALLKPKFHYSNFPVTRDVRDKHVTSPLAQIPLRRLPRGSFGEVGVMESGLKGTSRGSRHSGICAFRCTSSIFSCMLSRIGADFNGIHRLHKSPFTCLTFCNILERQDVFMPGPPIKQRNRMHSCQLSFNTVHHTTLRLIKMGPFYFGSNLEKCYPILIILSLSHSQINSR